MRAIYIILILTIVTASVYVVFFTSLVDRLLWRLSQRRRTEEALRLREEAERQVRQRAEELRLVRATVDSEMKKVDPVKKPARKRATKKTATTTKEPHV